MIRMEGRIERVGQGFQSLGSRLGGIEAKVATISTKLEDFMAEMRTHMRRETKGKLELQKNDTVADLTPSENVLGKLLKVEGKSVGESLKVGDEATEIRNKITVAQAVAEEKGEKAALDGFDRRLAAQAEETSFDLATMDGNDGKVEVRNRVSTRVKWTQQNLEDLPPSGTEDRRSAHTTDKSDVVANSTPLENISDRLRLVELQGRRGPMEKTMMKDEKGWVHMGQKEENLVGKGGVQFLVMSEGVTDGS